MDFINGKVKVSHVAAAQTEQGQTINETVLGGQLGIVQDILYTHPLCSKHHKSEGHLTLIDARNGNVLYT
jgi:hypothetical protein